MYSTIRLQPFDEKHITEEIEFLLRVAANNKKVKDCYDKLGGLDRCLNFCKKNYFAIIPINYYLWDSMNFIEKRQVRQLKNLYKYPQLFDKLFIIIFINEATLSTLDKNISKYFEKGYRENHLQIVCTESERYGSYEYVIQGISSKQIVWKKYEGPETLSKVITNILKTISKKDNSKDLQSIIVQYSAGTSAVS